MSTAPSPGSSLDADAFWSRIVPGRATVVTGGSPPPHPPGRVIITVPCDRPQRDLGAVLEARRRIERRIGHRAGLWELAADRVRSGIRRRLLADEPELERAWMLLEPLNRLQEDSDAPATLVFDPVEAADPASLALIEEAVGHPGRAGAALLLVLRSGGAERLVDAVRRVEGTGAVIDLREGTPAPRPSPVRRGRPKPSAPVWSVDRLPRDLRRLVRAAAVIGDVFEVDLIAGLLRVSELEVLEGLQDLIDGGAPMRDLGDGAFELDPSVGAAIREGVQDSLGVAWNLRLAELLGMRSDLHGDADVTRPSLSPVGVASPLTITTEVPAVGAIPDPARAAAHLEAAGETDHAAEGFLHAAREAFAFGADEQAAEHACHALALLDADPIGGPRRRVMAREAELIRTFVEGDEEDLAEAVGRLVVAQRALSDDPSSDPELAATETVLERLTLGPRRD